MRIYDGIHKKAKISGKEFDAFYPKTHSRLKGIVYSRCNLNSSDPWANIPKWETCFYIKKKGEKYWEKQEDSCLYHGIGLFKILFSLESDEEKERYKDKERLLYLRQVIPDLIKEKELLEEKEKSKISPLI